MPQFPLLCPTEDEVADALEALGEILDLDQAAEIDLPPYLTRLLLQLQETLLATRPQPREYAHLVRR
jgi:hypothetical protein